MKKSEANLEVDQQKTKKQPKLDHYFSGKEN